MRCGEIMALEWTDVDFTRQKLQVQRSEWKWKGKVTVPKGGRSRRVPMTSRLAEALRDHRHLRGPRVLCQQDGRPLTQKIVQVLVRKAARKANLANGGVDLRSTPEVSVRECLTRTGFEVPLESQSTLLISEPKSRDERPRSVFTCVPRFA